MRALLIIAALLTTDNSQRRPAYYPVGAPTVTPTLSIPTITDHVCFGVNCEFWHQYDATDGRFELWSSDCDGASTDCMVTSTMNGSRTFAVHGSGTGSVYANNGDRYIHSAHGFYGSTRVDDVIPTALILKAQDSYPPAVTNTSGADTWVQGGTGQKKIAVTAAGLTGDTVTPSINGVALTACTENGTNGTNNFDCQGETDAVCATNLATCLNGRPGLNACAGTGCATTFGFTGTAGTAYVEIAPNEGGVIVTLATSDAVNAVITSGVAGKVVLGGRTTASNWPIAYLGGTAATDSYMYGNANAIGFGPVAGGYSALTFGNLFMGGANVNRQMGASTAYDSWYSGAAYDTSFYRGSAGVLSTGTGTQATKIGDHSFVCIEKTAIDTSSAAKASIYTVPTAKVFWPMTVVIRDASAAITAATYTWGCDANATNMHSTVTALALADGAEFLKIDAEVGSIECAAAEVFGAKTGTPEGAADTVTMEVCGIVR